MNHQSREITLEDLPSLIDCPVDGLTKVPVRNVTEDSRKVTAGSVFVAVAGEEVDGHDYVATAKSQGAIAIIGERTGLSSMEGIPYLRVAHSRAALGRLAHEMASCPTADMCVIGVTGTNGKTSTAHFIERILQRSGHRTANLGTIENRIGEEQLSTSHTTPSVEELVDIFVRARDAGTEYTVMEVSSHALDQERVAGVEFDVAVFTNLTQDHLDYHKTLEEYLQAKLKLFERIDKESGLTVVNIDDPYGSQFVDASQGHCITIGQEGDCRATDVRHERSGTMVCAETPWGRIEYRTHLVGMHNVANTLSAIAVCGGLGLDIHEVVAGVESLERIPGRFEQIDEGQDFHVIVDYAHTDDGLKNVLEASRAICDGKIVVVFGCGGDRDKTKRPKMAQVAASLADYSIITSDNPRSESPEAILADTEVGMIEAEKQQGADYEIVTDRRDAIERGIAMAAPGDLVLIAGKGHEDYQLIGGERLDFDDRKVAREILEKVRG